LAETEPELCAACAVDEAEHHAEVVRDLIEDDFLKHRGRD
jgi:hypothetical protein